VTFEAGYNIPMSSFGFASGAFNSQTVFYSTSLALTQLRTLEPHAEPMEAMTTNSDRRTNQVKRPKWVRGAVE
jgi:hypothetical protein